MWIAAIRKGKCLIVSTLVLGLLLSSGCAKKSGFETLATGTVKGKVSLNGAPPPAGCQVTFMHKEKNFPATGEVGSDGSYTLTFNGKPDVPVGSYDVSVVPPPNAAAVSMDPSNPEAYKAVMMRKPGEMGAPLAQSVVPTKYQNPATSGLACTVLEGQEVVFDVQMTSSGGGPPPQ